jgi:hypothetical protein
MNEEGGANREDFPALGKGVVITQFLAVAGIGRSWSFYEGVLVSKVVIDRARASSSW